MTWTYNKAIEKVQKTISTLILKMSFSNSLNEFYGKTVQLSSKLSDGRWVKMNMGDFNANYKFESIRVNNLISKAWI